MGEGNFFIKKRRFIFLDRLDDEHKYWPVTDDFGMPPLKKDEVKGILESMINSFNTITDEEIEEIHKEISVEYEQYLKELNMDLNEIRERSIKNGYVYVLVFNDGKTKIGFSAEPKKRKKGIISGTMYEHKDVDWFIIYKTDDMEQLESLVHKEFDKQHVTKEWFDFTEIEITKCKECKFKKNISKLIDDVIIQCGG